MPAFDTHKAVKSLCSVGFNDSQAEAVVEQISGAVNEAIYEKVATKADMEGLAAATKTDMEKLAAATKADMERLAATTKTDMERLETKLDNSVERLEGEIEKQGLYLKGEMEKQATKYLRSIVVVAAAFVGLSKALDLLVG